MPQFIFRLSILLLVIVTPLAQAWGPAGHSIVGELAERQLTPKAREQIQQLLKGENDPTLAGVANWADEIRGDPTQKALLDETKRLHYVNFPRTSCHYQPERDCPNGKCVVAAIDHYASILGDHKQSSATRREALKFVVHFVGDIHQPLHAGYADDRGGNTYQINYHKRGWNLHSVWDSLIIKSRGIDWNDYAESLAKQPWRESVAPAENAPAAWAMQSCQLITKEKIYPRGHKISDRYLKNMRPLAELRLRQAGARLATLLNNALQ